MKKLIVVSAFLVLGGLLSACQGGNGTPYPTLPLPSVREEQLPTATPSNTPEPVTPELPTPTATGELQVQAWPTLDEEQYWISQIDALLDKIERELNSTDTRLKP